MQFAKPQITVQVIVRRDELSNFRNVSTSEPCPICGKPDWCSIQYVEGGEKLHYCRRVLCGDNIISPTDSRTYIFIKQARDGSCLYKEEQAYLAAKEEWKKNNGTLRGASPRKTAPSMPASCPVKAEPEIAPLENSRLDKIYRRFLQHLTLHKNHVRYFKDQGWSSDLIIRSMVKSMPPSGRDPAGKSTRESITSSLIREFGSLKGVPGFYEAPNGRWTFTGTGGILIPLFDCRKNLYRLRLRLDHPEVDENGKEKNKYNNISSFREIAAQGQGTKNTYRFGCRSGSHCGLYEPPGRDNYSVCYITEGEKKALYANYVLHHPVVSIPGVNSFNKVLETFGTNCSVLDYLKAKGCYILIIAYDSDKYVNEAVLMYEQKLARLLTSHNFQIALAYWNPGFGKGLDDILSLDVRPNYEMIMAC